MKILLFGSAILIGLIAVVGAVNYHRLGGSGPSEASQGPNPSGSKRAVVVELFTSEGCSSCPPADVLLSRLQESQPIPGAEIIALSEHVDYWNHLGWTDPYSSAQFSARQQRYAEVLGGEDIYTPQMIVDGRKAFVGSNESEARSAITYASEAAAAAVTLALDDKSPGAGRNQLRLLVSVDNIGANPTHRPLDVLLAITESGLRSSVRSGENGGRTLEHTSVVRKLISVGSINAKAAGSFTAEPLIQMNRAWRRDQIRAVVFIQDKSNMQIFGAASLPLSAN